MLSILAGIWRLAIRMAEGDMSGERLFAWRNAICLIIISAVWNAFVFWKMDTPVGDSEASHPRPAGRSSLKMPIGHRSRAPLVSSPCSNRGIPRLYVDGFMHCVLRNILRTLFDPIGPHIICFVVAIDNHLGAFHDRFVIVPPRNLLGS